MGVSKKALAQSVVTNDLPGIKYASIRALEEPGPPEIIYADAGGGFQNDLADLLQRERIGCRTTRTRAPFVERFIRTFKR